MSPVYEATTFENLSASLFFNSVCVRLVAVYWPPGTKPGLFLTEFSAYLEQLVNRTGKLVILGDYNIHLDDSLNPFSQNFLSTINSFGIVQHVCDTTRESNQPNLLKVTWGYDWTGTTWKVAGDDFGENRPMLETRHPDFYELLGWKPLLFAKLGFKKNRSQTGFDVFFALGHYPTTKLEFDPSPHLRIGS